LSDEHQRKWLAVADVRPTDDEGREFEVTYASDGSKQKVVLANRATVESVNKRAGELPDWSVEQIFLSDGKLLTPEERAGSKSRFFNIRTTEKEPDLVHVTINRLLRDANGGPLQKQVTVVDRKIDGKRVTLSFSDFASPGFLKVLLTREFRAIGVKDPVFD